MNDNSLMNEFIRWLEEKQMHFQPRIHLKSVENGVLYFTMDSDLVQLDVRSLEMCLSTSSPILSKASKLFQDRSNQEMGLQEILDTFTNSYGEAISAVEEEKEELAIDSKVQQMAKAFSGQGSSMSSKRIMQEYKCLVKSKECKGLRIEFENDSNIYTWIVFLNIEHYEFNEQFKRDFEQYARQSNRPKEIVFEVRFDSNYPRNPPFLRVIRPRFRFRTGHITIGGSICMQSITSSGWTSERTIENIFLEILYVIPEGGARLELGCYDRDYTLAEAREAFTRVARQHNWLR